MTEQQTPAPEATEVAEPTYFFALLVGTVSLSVPSAFEGSRRVDVNALFRAPADDDLNLTAETLGKLQLSLNNAAVHTFGLEDAKDITIHQTVISNIIMLGEMTDAQFNERTVVDAPAEA